MDPAEQLARWFEQFPGIGPRQAGRFVQHLLRLTPQARREFARTIEDLSGAIHKCTSCMRYFAGEGAVCGICANPKRDHSLLAIVASDTDLLALERSGDYRGMYFVLGGTVHLASEKAAGLRIRELLASFPERIENGLNEIILAFPANPEGDATAILVTERIKETSDGAVLTVTKLGRGLSTGSELEYADPETLKEALENRK